MRVARADSLAAGRRARSLQRPRHDGLARFGASSHPILPPGASTREAEEGARVDVSVVATSARAKYR